MRTTSHLVLAVALVACGSHAVPGPGSSSEPGGVDAAVAPTPACANKAMPPSDDVWSISSGGIARVVNVHVPAHYDPTVPTPLVVNFHGFTSDAIQEAILSQMNAESDASGFVVMYPVGTGAPLSWNAGACCGDAAALGVDDIGFASALVDAAAQRLCLDDKRVYATGMSNGGFLSHRIGCELADRFAAVAPVAGVLGVPTCAPSRPMPVMHFHGTADPLVPYDGSPALDFPAVPDTFAAWAARDGCTGTPVETYRNGDAHCSTYATCAGGAEVTLCTIDNGGHTWPGGTPVPALGATSTDISATRAMWTFFAAHPLP